MWVPKPVYDHAPSFWLLLGVLFFAGGFYLDFSDGLRAAYFVFGTFCFSHAAWTFLARRRNRRQAEARSMAEPIESSES